MATAAAAGARLLLALAAAVLCSSVAAGGGGPAAEQELIATPSLRQVAAVPAMYVFGDSLVDAGNNDFLPAPPAPRAVTPNGVDLPPAVSPRTGRFTNAYNLADIIAQHVGFKESPPAYLSLTPLSGSSLDLLQGRVGANYASGGSGILDATGNGTITLREQVRLFAETKAAMLRAAGLVGRARLGGLLARSLFVVSTGGNDFTAFVRGVPLSQAPEFTAAMVADYLSYINELYVLGARRLVLLDVLPVGCLPSQRATTADGECNGDGNYLAELFNSLLRAEMAKASVAMPGLNYSIASLYNVLSDMIADPAMAGLREVKTGCCGGGRFNGEVDCAAAAGADLCTDRDDYLFWDKVHGTQAAYRRAVLAFFYGPTRVAEPVNLDHLLREQNSATATAAYSSM
ncbi:hypothetical protein BS78_08G109500 [Paspalum vaginatum]|nr:hypothetical protein BS78_08G109500 [Paspalum vaginatum]